MPNKKVNKPKFTMIACIYAGDLPMEVENWCANNDISTHYDSSVVYIEKYDSDQEGEVCSPMSLWLQEIVLPMSDEHGWKIAVEGT
jgi:formylmethanofuran dehydrogenase subunit D